MAVRVGHEEVAEQAVDDREVHDDQPAVRVGRARACPSKINGSGTTATAATMAMPVRYSNAVSCWRAVLVNTKYAVHDTSAPTASTSPYEAVGASAVTAEHHDRRARHRHGAPHDLGAPGPLAEQRAGHREHEDRLERADHGGVGDARLLHRAEEEDEVGREREPAGQRQRGGAASVSRPPVARKSDGDDRGPEPDPVAGHPEPVEPLDLLDRDRRHAPHHDRRGRGQHPEAGGDARRRGRRSPAHSRGTAGHSLQACRTTWWSSPTGTSRRCSSSSTTRSSSTSRPGSTPTRCRRAAPSPTSWATAGPPCRSPPGPRARSASSTWPAQRVTRFLAERGCAGAGGVVRRRRRARSAASCSRPTRRRRRRRSRWLVEACRRLCPLEVPLPLAGRGRTR